MNRQDQFESNQAAVKAFPDPESAVLFYGEDYQPNSSYNMASMQGIDEIVDASARMVITWNNDLVLAQKLSNDERFVRYEIAR